MNAGLHVAEGVLRYHAGARHGVSPFEVEIPPFDVGVGEVCTLVGGNGSGKSTLLAHLGGIDARTRRAQGVESTWDGRPSSIACSFLAASPMLVPGHAAEDYLALVVPSGRPDDREVVAALERVGLRELRRECTDAFSSGQRKRLGLARVLLQAEPLILLDEARANLDEQGRDLVDQLMHEWLDQGRTIVMATHHDSDWQRAACKLTFERVGHTAGVRVEIAA